MKISYKELFLQLTKVEFVDLYVSQLSLNEYDPFMKAWKKVPPTKVRVSRYNGFSYNEGDTVRNYDLKRYLHIKPYGKNNKLSTKTLNIVPNGAGEPCEFFSDFRSAAVFWNAKVKKFDGLMTEKLKALTKYQVTFKNQIEDLK